jgi:5-methylcytosine-specific restriction enzyme subunit McrC
LECLSFLESRITVLELKQEISELFKWLENVNRSMNIQNDFRDYENNPKWVLEYASIMPFVTLILSGYQLIPMAGNLPGISILYPSEKLFESFIATLISIVQPDWKIRRKERSQFIFDDGSANLRFNGLWMEPDLVSHRKKLIMDTKWKILNERSDFLGISSSDLYQVYTYVSTYSNKSVSSWKVCLIYPGFQNQTKGFRLKTMDGFKFMIYRFDMNSSNLRKEITEMITFFERDLYVKNSSV